MGGVATARTKPLIDHNVLLLLQHVIFPIFAWLNVEQSPSRTNFEEDINKDKGDCAVIFLQAVALFVCRAADSDGIFADIAVCKGQASRQPRTGLVRK